MRSLFITIVLALFAFTSYTLSAQSLATKSLTNIGNQGWDILSDIAFDSEGNYYITGSFSDTMNIDGHTLITNGRRDIFLLKLNSSNKVEWAKRIGGAGDENAYSLQCDKENNIYLAGAFSETMELGGQLQAQKITDLFLVKYNTTGDVQWSKVLTSTSLAKKAFLQSDNEGNIWLGGNYAQQISFGGNVFNTTNQSAIFVIKYNTSGEVVQSFDFNNNGTIVLNDFIIDKDNGLYFAGYYEKNLQLGTFSLVAEGKKDAYIAKYTQDGNIVWLQSAGSKYNDEAKSISVDENNNLYVTGDFKDEILFATTSLITDKANEVFIANLSANDGTLKWANKLGGNSSNYSSSVTAAENNKFYLNGTFIGELSAGETPINSKKQSKDIFIARYRTDGNRELILQAGGDKEDQMMLNYSTSTKELYSSGFYSSDFKLFNDSVDNKNYKDVFVGRLVDCGLLPKVDLGADVAFCEGATFVIDAGDDFETYAWNGTVGESQLNVNLAGTYIAEVTDKLGCFSTDTIILTTLPSPMVDLGPDVAAPGDSTIYIDAGPGFASYLWPKNNTARKLCVPMHYITAPTDIWVLVTDENGCTATDTIIVSVGIYEPPTMAAKSTEVNESEIISAELQEESMISINYNIFPNPTNGIFYVQVSDAQTVKQIDLFDLRGNLIQTFQNIKQFPFEADLSNYPKGIYLLKVSEENTSREFKIIHQ